jgi:hypothetical protein
MDMTIRWLVHRKKEARERTPTIIGIRQTRNILVPGRRNHEKRESPEVMIIPRRLLDSIIGATPLKTCVCVCLCLCGCVADEFWFWYLPPQKE